jgi:hypothetical protein
MNNKINCLKKCIRTLKIWIENHSLIMILTISSLLLNLIQLYFDSLNEIIINENFVQDLIKW